MMSMKDTVSETEDVRLPTPIYTIKTALAVMPRPVIDSSLSHIMKGMEKLHRKFFRRLKKIAPAIILFNSVDIRYSFLLTIRADNISLETVSHDMSADVVIKGRLCALLNLFEGHNDFDTAFFNRDVMMTGNTAIAIGFRNIIDGEPMSLLEDALQISYFPQELGKKIILKTDKHISFLKKNFQDIKMYFYSKRQKHAQNQEEKTYV